VCANVPLSSANAPRVKNGFPFCPRDKRGLNSRAPIGPINYIEVIINLCVIETFYFHSVIILPSAIIDSRSDESEEIRNVSDLCSSGEIPVREELMSSLVARTIVILKILVQNFCFGKSKKNLTSLQSNSRQILIFCRAL